MGKKNSLKHLGTLHGRGPLAPRDGGAALGTVTYEIDGYLDRDQRTGNGHVEGEPDTLARAFAAGPLVLTLEGGVTLDITLADPDGDSVAEVILSGGFPA